MRIALTCAPCCITLGMETADYGSEIQVNVGSFSYLTQETIPVFCQLPM